MRVFWMMMILSLASIAKSQTLLSAKQIRSGTNDFPIAGAHTNLSQALRWISGNMARSNELAALIARAVTNPAAFDPAGTATGTVAALSNALGSAAFTSTNAYPQLGVFNSLTGTVAYFSQFADQSNAITDGIQAWAALQFDALGSAAGLSNAVWAQAYATNVYGANLGATAVQEEVDPDFDDWYNAGFPGTVTMEIDPALNQWMMAGFPGVATNSEGANLGATSLQSGSATIGGDLLTNGAVIAGGSGATGIVVNGVVGSYSNGTLYATVTDNDTTYKADGIYLYMDGTTIRPRTWWADMILQDNLLLRADIMMDGAVDVVPGGVWSYDNTNQIDRAVSSNFTWRSGFANRSTPEDIVAYWRMDDDAASTTVSEDVAGANGTATQNTADMHAAGKLNGALLFNGSSDYVNIGTSSTFNPEAMTISAWFKTTYAGENWIFTRDYEGGRSYCLGTGSGGGTNIIADLQVVGGAGGGGGSLHVGNGAWHHIVARGSEAMNAWEVWIDGALDVSFAWCSMGSTPDTDTRIGSRQYGGYEGYFNGTIDDVRFYDRAITTDAIAALWNGGAGSPGYDMGSILTNMVLSTLNRPIPAGTADTVLATWAVDTTNSLTITNLAVDVSANGGTNWWGTLWTQSAWYSNVLWVSAQGTVSNSLSPAIVKSRLRVLTTNPPAVTVRGNVTMGGNAQ